MRREMDQLIGDVWGQADAGGLERTRLGAQS